MFGRFFVGWGYCRVSLVGLLSHVFPQVRGVPFAGKISSKNTAKISHKYFAKPTIIRIFAVLKNTSI
jgi:hypothetical protein